MCDKRAAAREERGALSSPVRIQTSITSRAEQALIAWLCPRLPHWWTPDRLTALGMLGSFMVALGFVLSHWGRDWLFLAMLGFVVNWFGDSLDGSIARHRKIERPDYGYFIDHSLDALSQAMLVLGMGLSPYLRMDTALFGLVGYLLLSVHTFISARVLGVFRLTYLGSGPTEMRMMLIVLCVAMYVVGPQGPVGQPFAELPFTWFDGYVVVLGTAMCLIFLWQTAITGRQLFQRGK
ncbi:CDP-alcohol phosphatidyltransferase family protein [Altererythrobacter buctensis]|uniref:CDP-alcohol phosphatidyltransferase family protein n=1 Tax=Alteraurantiacibacter buctensis TaxID=1503981 RepID=A0A844YWD5_9SPHN|nr:CDP-alcohol phosphatidyltransferase family protein [Alteraurantiacibacter buctensis]